VSLLDSSDEDENLKLKKATEKNGQLSPSK
jgi:hypothetical protein